jgi:hypothetical protein
MRVARIVQVRRLESIAAAVTDFLSAYPRVSWAAFVVIAIVGAAPLLRRPLWFDEIVYYHIATLPTLTDIWAALRAGADSNPPLGHELVRLAYAGLGQGEWQHRLPSLIAFLVMLACLYSFVRRRCSVVAAWCAAVTPLLASGAAYMAEGRPYALVLGFGSLALVCWQRSVARDDWSPWLVGTALCIGAGALSHSVGVYALVPIACGEAAHQLTGGRLRVSRWLTLAAAVIPTAVMWHTLLGFLHLIGTDNWDAPRLASLVSGYRILFGMALAPAMVGLCLIACLRSDDLRETEPRASWMPLPEAVAGLGFAIIPALAVLAAMATSGPFVPRYGIAGLIGLGVIAAGVAVFIERRRTEWASLLLVSLMVGLGLQTVDRWMKMAPPFSVPSTLLADETDLPIVVDGPLDYLQLAYYAPPRLQRRLVSLVDTSAAELYVGAGKGDLSLVLLRPVAASLRVETLAEFLRKENHFRVFRGAVPGWVLPKLIDDGARVRIVSFRTTDAIFDVSTLPGETTAQNDIPAMVPGAPR